MKWSQAASVLLASSGVNAFVVNNNPSQRTAATFANHQLHKHVLREASVAVPTILRAAPEDEDNDETPFNPYADPNYPELEFINYDDPEYVVDQGDEFSGATTEDTTEEEIEAMREERRRKNDEYQFETYHAECLKSGDQFKGEWTVYRTSTFMEGVEDAEDAKPRFKKENDVMRVVASGRKIKVDEKYVPDGGYTFRVDGERLVHEERIAEAKDFEEDDEWEELVHARETGEDGNVEELVGRTYCPSPMSSFDFRGPAGAMCVGNCYTIANATPIDTSKVGTLDGPYSELRTEIGIQYKRMRFRVKWDYRTKAGSEDEGADASPALHLYSMIVCRETRERWPRYASDRNVDDSFSEKLFGAPGANGGLYDPPPVGSSGQASQYMFLDLEGGASVLFPHKIDQDPNEHDGNGWVQTLDWAPGRIRYQADRKVHGGAKIRGLRSLELSEVQSEDADQWRPNDSGTDMLQ
mmetsp:Transcript_22256/g.32510  ORF Transcript_22256/g.32510 Transcript_22256/m.32510 type:complete len:468 (+) Transcript_22256:80-1483(+)|eukprot:CAMPEP_0197244422 /NCGR_PEP_ID=MMETSP1429-20130617/9549_1 /TAXON_ID=49237 /ORGANISM="Chaetoceros  sp., Strain UNC1202" /LENGTH=467 /DNA_ID=CAMNT_0042704781 /DNA_START=66 /DNA_END=1469 /DNA_ORIENTATION=+